MLTITMALMLTACGDKEVEDTSADVEKQTEEAAEEVAEEVTEEVTEEGEE